LELELKASAINVDRCGVCLSRAVQPTRAAEDDCQHDRGGHDLPRLTETPASWRTSAFVPRHSRVPAFAMRASRL
jgi:hypothetical protein